MICPKCGTVNDKNYKFCLNCGQPLSQTAVQSEANANLPVNNQSSLGRMPVPETPNNYPTSEADFSSMPNLAPINRASKKLTLIIVIIVLLILGLLGLAASFSLFKNAASRYNTNSNGTQVSSSTASLSYPTPLSFISPTPYATNTPAPKIIKFTNVSDAYNYVATSDNIPNIANARLYELDILFSQNAKQWTFYFWNGSNNLVKLSLSDTGNFNKDSQSEVISPSFMQTMPDPKTVINQNYIDPAKQKMVGLGFQPSATILSAKYTVCDYCSDHKQQWSIILPIAGEESKGTMKAKEFVFQDGSYTQSSDVTFFIY